jgi:hypothetical protein
MHMGTRKGEVPSGISGRPVFSQQDSRSAVDRAGRFKEDGNPHPVSEAQKGRQPNMTKHKLLASDGQLPVF